MEDPTPTCCGRAMTVVRSGVRANFAIWIWRCPVCERYTSTNRRYDGEHFWVGAVGRLVAEKTAELFADAYRGG